MYYTKLCVSVRIDCMFISINNPLVVCVCVTAGMCAFMYNTWLCFCLHIVIGCFSITSVRVCLIAMVSQLVARGLLAGCYGMSGVY